MTEVISEIEAGVLDEHGMGQAEGDGHDSPPECGELIETDGEVPVQVLQGQGGTGEQPESDDLHRLLGNLQAEECRVQTAKPAHG